MYVGEPALAVKSICLELSVVNLEVFILVILSSLSLFIILQSCKCTSH